MCCCGAGAADSSGSVLLLHPVANSAIVRTPDISFNTWFAPVQNELRRQRPWSRLPTRPTRRRVPVQAGTHQRPRRAHALSRVRSRSDPSAYTSISFRPSHPAPTIAVAFPCARPDLIPLNGPTSFPRNGPRRPTAVASGNLSFRLGFAMQLRARAQGDGGSPHAVLALYLQNGICANQGRVLRMVFSSVPIRHRIWSPESGFSRSRPAADAVSNDGRDGAV